MSSSLTWKSHFSFFVVGECKRVKWCASPAGATWDAPPSRLKRKSTHAAATLAMESLAGALAGVTRASHKSPPPRIWSDNWHKHDTCEHDFRSFTIRHPLARSKPTDSTRYSIAKSFSTQTIVFTKTKRKGDVGHMKLTLTTRYYCFLGDIFSSTCFNQFQNLIHFFLTWAMQYTFFLNSPLSKTWSLLKVIKKNAHQLFADSEKRVAGILM
jgi:hypothetical protein